MKKGFRDIGLKVPEIMLPAEGCEMEKWSVIACDQYTSQPEYWDEVKRLVGDSPSTYHVTLPEIYLKEADVSDRIARINSNMEKYLSLKTIVTLEPGFVLVDRCTPHAPSRKGLIAAADLESYSYAAGAQTLIRATEGTVLDRIPPRVRIRENASIELPHIMLLIDDPDRTVIEPLFSKLEASSKLYDFELMLGGGRIRGWKADAGSLCEVEQALCSLADPDGFRKKYDVGTGFGVLLFAAGDGNHSLATAKAHWENIKSTLPKEPAGGLPDHPARYALVEIVNVHDEGIIFEPIHRVLFGVDSRTVLEGLKKSAEERQVGTDIRYRLFPSKEEMEAEARHIGRGSCHTIPFILEGSYGILTVENPVSGLEVGTLQTLLDGYLKKCKAEIDYIHGDQVVTELGSKSGNLGFYLPAMDKRDLFRTVIREGALPRKTFSMGEAEEKRYYLECRRIK